MYRSVFVTNYITVFVARSSRPPSGLGPYGHPDCLLALVSAMDEEK